MSRQQSLKAAHRETLIPKEGMVTLHPGDPYSPCPFGLNCTKRIDVVATGPIPRSGGGFPAITQEGGNGITRPSFSGLTNPRMIKPSACFVGSFKTRAQHACRRSGFRCVVNRIAHRRTRASAAAHPKSCRAKAPNRERVEEEADAIL